MHRRIDRQAATLDQFSPPPPPTPHPHFLDPWALHFSNPAWRPRVATWLLQKTARLTISYRDPTATLHRHSRLCHPPWHPRQQLLAARESTSRKTRPKQSAPGLIVMVRVPKVSCAPTSSFGSQACDRRSQALTEKSNCRTSR